MQVCCAMTSALRAAVNTGDDDDSEVDDDPFKVQSLCAALLSACRVVIGPELIACLPDHSARLSTPVCLACPSSLQCSPLAPATLFDRSPARNPNLVQMFNVDDLDDLDAMVAEARKATAPCGSKRRRHLWPRRFFRDRWQRWHRRWRVWHQRGRVGLAWQGARDAVGTARWRRGKRGSCGGNVGWCRGRRASTCARVERK